MSSEMDVIIDVMAHDQKVRRTITRENHLLFFSVYFSHYIEYAFADFHREMFDLSSNDLIQTLVVTAARGIGKSTVLNMSLAIWSILGKQKKKYVIISSRTQAKARQHYNNLKKELEENTLLKNDLGPFKEENNEWGSSLVLPYYDARITFVSTEQSIRGMRHKQHRPDLIIADDLDDNESVKTFDGRNKTYEWLTKDVIPAGNEHTRLVIIGTLLHEDSVIIRFKKEIVAGTRTGVYREYPLVDASGTILWKERYPDTAAIEAERMRIGNDKAWAQEFLLRIVSDHERVVHPEWVQYSEAPQGTAANHYRGTFIGIDPAISEERRAACTAMVVVKVFGWGESMRIYVEPYPVNERITFPVILERARYLSDHHHKAKIFVEDVGFQKGLVQALDQLRYPVEGIRPQGDKRARLAAISHHIKNGTIQFAPRGNEELVMQVVNFGSEHFMDIVDALSMVVSEVVNTQRGYRPFPDLERFYPRRPELGEDDDFAHLRPITAGLRKKIF